MIAQPARSNNEVSGLVDHDLAAVRSAILDLDADGLRFAGVVRRTYDMLLDGVHTGRYRWEQLHKTEKTHCGTLVEINLQREFGFADGDVLDYKIQGIEVDCKFSQDDGKWMIPLEAIGHILLVVWANDQLGILKAGLVRAAPELLTRGSNRDNKRILSSGGRAQVVVLYEGIAIADNVLLRLPAADEEAIFSHRTGQQRVNELFRRVQCRPISRTAVATVAQQHDYMKRVRDNGGARKALAAEGIVILGQSEVHRRIASHLRIAIPGRGDFVSVRLAHRTAGHSDAPSIAIDSIEWVVAAPNDPVTEAPQLPATDAIGSALRRDTAGDVRDAPDCGRPVAGSLPT